MNPERESIEIELRASGMPKILQIKLLESYDNTKKYDQLKEKIIRLRKSYESGRWTNCDTDGFIEVLNDLLENKI